MKGYQAIGDHHSTDTFEIRFHLFDQVQRIDQSERHGVLQYGVRGIASNDLDQIFEPEPPDRGRECIVSRRFVIQTIMTPAPLALMWINGANRAQTPQAAYSESQRGGATTFVAADLKDYKTTSSPPCRFGDAFAEQNEFVFRKPTLDRARLAGDFLPIVEAHQLVNDTKYTVPAVFGEVLAAARCPGPQFPGDFSVRVFRRLIGRDVGTPKLAIPRALSRETPCLMVSYPVIGLRASSSK